MTAYTELSTPAEMRADCRAAADRLPSPVAPSLRYEDRPRETPKPRLEISEAAAALAAALHLHLD